MNRRGLVLLLAVSVPWADSPADTLTRVANTSLNLPATTPTEGAYTVVNAFGSLSFNRPLAVRTPPGETGFTYVVERGGKIQRVNLATNTKSEFLDLAAWVDSQGSGWALPSGSENGLLSLAFHPDYNQNGHFYVFYSLTANNQLHQRVARLTATGTPGNYLAATTCNPATHVALITQRDEAGNHNGGDMHFGADGYLYISVGDEGGADDTYDNGNFINKDFFSAILRIDVDHGASSLAPNSHSQTNSATYASAVHSGTYKIPADNPFIGATSHQGQTISAGSVRTEIWLTGLRNPWRFSLDAVSNRWFIGDVGQNAREEVTMVTYDPAESNDAGWSRREGTAAFPWGPAGSSVPSGYSPLEPIHDYPRSDGRSITGGIVYRGARLGELYGKYVFADYLGNKIWALTEDTAQNPATWTRSDVLGWNGIVSFDHDPANRDILLCVMNENYVGRLVRAPGSNPAPATLGATGAFTDLSTLAPAGGIYAYDINHPFWSDHALKRRWFSIPQVSDQMAFSADGAWSFPAGQVWIKHFDLETERGNAATKKPVETRFLVRTASGAYGLSYRWRADGSDADLVGSSGLHEDFTITTAGGNVTQTWIYPSRADCLTCHTPASNYALSFNTRQLNRGGALGADQLHELDCAGFLQNSPPASQSLPAHPAADDSTASREARVRSYLEVNCAMCHRGPGSPVPGQFDARTITSTDMANLINGTLSNNLGDPANRFVAPNDITHSVVLKKLDGSAGRMPPLASTVTDQEIIALLSAWITDDLPARQSYGEWALAAFGETGTPRSIQTGDFDMDGQSNFLEYLAATSGNDATSKFQLNLSGNQLSFTHPANRSLLIETSPDLQTWLPLAHPDNTLKPPAVGQDRSFTLPAADNLFYRAVFSAP